MKETLPGATTQELKERIEPAINAAKAVGSDMYSLRFENGGRRGVTEVVGEVSAPDTIILQGVGERVDRLDARTEKRYPDGSSASYHAFRDEKRGGAQATRITRRDAEGRIERELTVRRPKAVTLVADRAVERILEQAESRQAA